MTALAVYTPPFIVKRLCFIRIGNNGDKLIQKSKALLNKKFVLLASLPDFALQAHKRHVGLLEAHAVPAGD